MKKSLTKSLLRSKRKKEGNLPTKPMIDPFIKTQDGKYVPVYVNKNGRTVGYLHGRWQVITKEKLKGETVR